MNNPPYWQPVGQPDGSILSIDNIVINVTTHQPWSNVEGKLREIFGAENVRTPKRKSIYQEGWSIAIDQDSFFFAVTPREQGRLIQTKGRIDFNPNKLMNYEGFLEFLLWLERSTAAFDPVRFDLAHDFPLDFSRVLLVKDRRTMRTTTQTSTTYYLGTFNKPGHVRLYNKALQCGLPSLLTRCEMTCDAEWGVTKIKEQAPRLVLLGNPTEITTHERGATPTIASLSRVMAKATLQGIDIQDEVKMLDYRTRKNVVNLMRKTDLSLFPLDAIVKIKEQTRTWQRSKGPLRAINCLRKDAS